MTFGQLEAMLWVVELGTFERAANRLNTTQSTISKRIQELELSTGLKLFDRSKRGARLTIQGEQLLEHARQAVALQSRILNLKEDAPTVARRLRLGVTELSALTWLPRFVTRLRQVYPTITIEPEVDMSRSLYERLIEGRLDLIVIPESMVDKDINVLRLAEVENAWMTGSDAVVSQEPLTLPQLTEYPIITQGSRSGSGLFFIKWLKSEGAVLQNTIAADSMMAAVAMTVAGFGITYLPKDCFGQLISDGKLTVVPSVPQIPANPYAAMYRRDIPSTFLDEVSVLAQQTCDFTHLFQGS